MGKPTKWTSRIPKKRPNYYWVRTHEGQPCIAWLTKHNEMWTNDGSRIEITDDFIGTQQLEFWPDVVLTHEKQAWMVAEMDRLRVANSEMRDALSRIAKWHGEFPPTGRFWDEPKNTDPMSYAAAFGSNGERDFMRGIANEALGLNPDGSPRAPGS